MSFPVRNVVLKMDVVTQEFQLFYRIELFFPNMNIRM